jgi:hypothetical protein
MAVAANLAIISSSTMSGAEFVVRCYGGGFSFLIMVCELEWASFFQYMVRAGGRNGGFWGCAWRDACGLLSAQGFMESWVFRGLFIIL